MAITPDQLIHKVREVARANPDFVYTPRHTAEVHGMPDEYDGEEEDTDPETTCTYVGPTPEKCCIFGRALIDFGIAKPEWDEPDSGTHRLNTLAIRELVDELVANKVLDAPSVVQRMWMSRVQEQQDTGADWEVAVYRADHPDEAV